MQFFTRTLFRKIIFLFSLSIVFLLIFNHFLSYGSSGKDHLSDRKKASEEIKWYMGNTHAHTKILDLFPRKDISAIITWYKNDGYDFLAVTDHNTHDGEKKVICHEETAADENFLLLCGLELSHGKHMTALGIDRYIGDEKSLQDGTDKIIAAGGIPVLNHPQYPVTDSREFLSVKGLNHLEIFNGKRPWDTEASENLWDSILSSPERRRVYAIASDDNHYSRRKAGMGWIMVEAASLKKEDIMESIRKGNFYASTGIFLKNYIAGKDEIMVDTENGTLITFIGYNGRILSRVNGSKAIFTPPGDEVYIRVKITGKDEKTAWTQPLFLK